MPKPDVVAAALDRALNEGHFSVQDAATELGVDRRSILTWRRRLPTTYRAKLVRLAVRHFLEGRGVRVPKGT